MFSHLYNLGVQSPYRKTHVLDIITVICIALVTVYCFYPAVDNGFVYWDDQYYVTDNPLVSNPSFANAKELLTAIISLNYHPVTMLSLWVNSLQSGTLSAYSFIVTNIVLHTINVMLVFLLVRMLTVSRWIAGITALVFAIHPMHVESVVWVSERKDVLYTLFFLLASIAYLHYNNTDKKKYYFATLLFFFLSCMSKAMAVSLVPVLYLLDLYSAKRLNNWTIHLSKFPFIIISLLVGYIAIDVQSGGSFYNLLEPTINHSAIKENIRSVWDNIQVACFGLYFYIEQFVLPTKMSALHPFTHLEEKQGFPFYIFCPILILLITIYFRKNKSVVFGVGFFLATVFLVLQFMQVGNAFAADRYTYLPYIGLAFILANCIDFLSRKTHNVMALLCSLIIAILLIPITREQSDVWQNHVSLFSNVVEQYPNSGLAREYLASGLWTQGKTDLAINELEYAIDNLDHLQSSAYDLLANCYSDKGEIVHALKSYDLAIALDSTNYTARYHKGLLLIQIDPVLAIDEFNRCAGSQDIYVRQLVYEPRAYCYVLIGDYERSILDYSRAIELGQNMALNYYDRGITYETMGNISAALDDYKRAFKIDSSMLKAEEKIKELDQLASRMR